MPLQHPKPCHDLNFRRSALNTGDAWAARGIYFRRSSLSQKVARTLGTVLQTPHHQLPRTIVTTSAAVGIWGFMAQPANSPERWSKHVALWRRRGRNSTSCLCHKAWGKVPATLLCRVKRRKTHAVHESISRRGSLTSFALHLEVQVKHIMTFVLSDPYTGFERPGLSSGESSESMPNSMSPVWIISMLPRQQAS